jgi:hypothetical protein
VGGAWRLLDCRRPDSEDPRIDLRSFGDGGPIVVALIVAIVVLAVIVLLLARRVMGLDARLRGLTRGEDGDLEAVLGAHIDRVYALRKDVERLASRAERLEAGAPHAFQRTALVRFNPFEDTGGNQSFALALLDADGNGWVLSSLHARTGTRMYAKAVRGGRADGALSDEETAAIRQATA